MDGGGSAGQPIDWRQMVARNDLRLYERDDWWEPQARAFASLRAVTAYRLQLLQRWLGDELRRGPLVDLGCGGGFLAVPLARAGAAVLGVDLALPALRAAQRQQSGAVFVRGDLQAVPLQPQSARVVLLADVLEHLPRPGLAVAEAARLLQPGGLLFVNTLSRTLRARLLAVHLGEGLRLIPRGTHDPRLFVRPDELEQHGRAAGLQPRALQGERPRLWRTLRSWRIELQASRSTAIGYSMLLHKPA